MTNASKYKEVFGCEPIDEYGEYQCPPNEFRTCCTGIECIVCKKWWNEEYKEPERENKQMANKAQLISFLSSNAIMINSLMTNKQSRKFKGDIVSSIIENLKK